MEGWSSRSLSFAGRIELIKSVVSSYFIYWTQSYKLPLSVCRNLESLVAKFIWKGNLHGCSWSNLCTPKSEEGVGIRRIHDVCTAASLKLVWHCCTSNSLWAEWMSKAHFSNSSIWDAPIHPMSSGTWKVIANARQTDIMYKLPAHQNSDITDT